MTLPEITSVVGGKPISTHGHDPRLYASVDPSATDETVALVQLADARVFQAACSAAHEAQPAWAAVPAPVRGRVVAALGRLVERNKEALAALVIREVGKPYREALGEVQEFIDTCDFFLGEGRRLYGQTIPSEMPDKHLSTYRRPLGTALVITAGNFPVAVPSWYLVPALLTGNTVVWKPAEYASATANALFTLCERAGLPPGVLNLVLADGPTTFTGLRQALEAGQVQKVGFTGSSDVGARIGELCGRHLQSPCLELGGKNPMVVCADADLDLAVQGALFSGFGTAGQRCTSLGTVLVNEDLHGAFLERFARATEEAVIGHPSHAEVLYGPMMEARFAAAHEEHLGWIGDHHRVLGSSAVGRITAAAPRAGFVGDPARGLYYHPVIVDGVTPEDRLFTEETFGPLVGVTAFRTLGEAIELAQLPGYGLSAAVYTRDAPTAFRFTEAVGAGMVSVNNTTSGAEAHLPFGGNGRSGNGSRQSGMWVLDQFTRWQAVNWDWSGGLQKAQIDTAVIVAEPDFLLGAVR